MPYGYFRHPDFIKLQKKTIMKIEQKEILDTIQRMCGKAIALPSLGWHFMYNGQIYLYVAGDDESMLRLCIPFVAGITTRSKKLLEDAVAATNRGVKFVKTQLSGEGKGKGQIKVSLDYDHKTLSPDAASAIVPHMIRTLAFAADYLLDEMKNRGRQ